MAFTKKTWKDRVAEYINRRRLVDVDTSETQTVSVIREEGTVSEAGDAFNATNMNDLEDRIDTAFGALSASDVAYDNTNSGMAASTAQEAIDGMGAFVNTIQADYSLNTTANTIVGAINETATAEGTTYDNTTSGLSATEVQSAIDELGTYEKYYPTSTYGTFVFERFGLIKTVEVNGLSGMPLDAGQYLEFTLSSSFIPLNESQQATFPIIEPNTGSALRMYIFSDGRVRIYNYSTTVSNYPNLRMTSVYI